MCKSVPQIEAVFTRTSTSVGPFSGTATVSICKPFEARIFRNAFIVAAIYLVPRWNAQSPMLAPPVPPTSPRGTRRGGFSSSSRQSFHLLHNPNLLQRLQILHHHLQRHRPILRRHRIAYLLDIPLPICKIQHLIRVLFARSPQSVITQQLR